MEFTNKDKKLIKKAPDSLKAGVKDLLGRKEPYMKARQLSPEEFYRIINNAIRGEKVVLEPLAPENVEKKIVPIGKILQMEEKEQPFLIEKMIPENAITGLTSETGKGKSLIALKFVMHIAKGKKLFDTFEVKKRKVLFIDLEMNENDIINRSKTVVGEDIGIDFIYQQDFLIDDENEFEWLVKKVKENNYGLVVFDTFTQIHTKEENSATEMKMVNKKLLELIARTETTILYLHHHYKTRGHEKSGARGSTDIRAKLASHLSIESRPGLTIEDLPRVQVIMTQEKARLMHRFDKIAFDYFNNPKTDKTEWIYRGDVDLKAKAIDKAKEFVMEHLEKGEATIKDFLAEVEAKNLSLGKETIRNACKKLEDSEKLVSHKGKGKGHNTNFYSLPAGQLL